MTTDSAVAREASDAGAIVNIAAYKFVALDSLPTRRAELKQLCQTLGLRGTILLSREGINLFLAGSREAIDRLLTQLRSDPCFEDLEVKESLSDKQPFNRMLVKLKREIISFGVSGIEPSRATSPKISAQQLRQWLDEGKPLRLLDVRNDYEVDLGTFARAEQLKIQHFRQFPAAVGQLPAEAKDQPLVMFCTGGIRCEKAGPLMEQLGFREVYQLDGGILKYFEECGGEHYAGDCFVFDDRVALNPQLEPSGVLQCYNCQAVLNQDDVQSDKYAFGSSCPYCYRTSEEAQQSQLTVRQQRLTELAAAQPGCQPYDNRRLMHVRRTLAGLSVIDFLCAFHPPTPREQWLEWLVAGAITTHGRRVDAAEVVREGQQFEHTQRGVTEPAVSSAIRLLHEDEGLVVVDKPAPLPVHPCGRYNRNTLLSLLSEVYRPEKLRTAHRLDANTTGLVVLCRKFAAARVLQPMFAEQRVQKRYLLRVLGHPAADSVVCEAPISAAPTEVGARVVVSDGLPARTVFRVLQRCDDGTALVEAEPTTGRTNQIRVHAWHVGWPIQGDPLYLPGQELGTQQTLSLEQPPLCLHAWRLQFEHPLTRKTVQFEAPEPPWA
jgi:UPF0176 protein